MDTSSQQNQAAPILHSNHTTGNSSSTNSKMWNSSSPSTSIEQSNGNKTSTAQFLLGQSSPTSVQTSFSLRNHNGHHHGNAHHLTYQQNDTHNIIMNHHNHHSLTPQIIETNLETNTNTHTGIITSTSTLIGATNVDTHNYNQDVISNHQYQTSTLPSQNIHQNHDTKQLPFLPKPRKEVSPSQQAELDPNMNTNAEANITPTPTPTPTEKATNNFFSSTGMEQPVERHDSNTNSQMQTEKDMKFNKEEEQEGHTNNQEGDDDCDDVSFPFVLTSSSSISTPLVHQDRHDHRCQNDLLLLPNTASTLKEEEEDVMVSEYLSSSTSQQQQQHHQGTYQNGVVANSSLMHLQQSSQIMSTTESSIPLTYTSTSPPPLSTTTTLTPEASYYISSQSQEIRQQQQSEIRTKSLSSLSHHIEIIDSHPAHHTQQQQQKHDDLSLFGLGNVNDSVTVISPPFAISGTDETKQQSSSVEDSKLSLPQHQQQHHYNQGSISNGVGSHLGSSHQGTAAIDYHAHGREQQQNLGATFESTILGPSDSILSFLNVPPNSTEDINNYHHQNDAAAEIISSQLGHSSTIIGSGMSLNQTDLLDSPHLPNSSVNSINTHHSNYHQHGQRQEIEESIGFSKLMQQADNTAQTQSKSVFKSQMDGTNMLLSDIPLEESAQTQVLPNTISSPLNNNRSLHNKNNRNDNGRSVTMGKSHNDAASNNRFGTSGMVSRGQITYQTTSSRSFQVIVPISSNVATVRDVIDIVSNPDLLRLWYEPVKALIVTEQRGRSPPSSFCSSGGDGEGTPKFWRIKERRDDDDDGHVIIGSAEEEEAIGSSQDREQHDGEWIQASTTALVEPRTSCVDSYVVNSKTALGFPSTGNVTMFIERNKGQVGITVGPFRGGNSLSHQITVTEENGVGGEGCLKLVDTVKIIEKEEESESYAAIFCSCFETVFDTIKEWSAPSMDGYMKQTITSMGKLRALIDNGGEIGAHSINVGQVSIVSFIEEKNDSRRPLLG